MRERSIETERDVRADAVEDGDTERRARARVPTVTKPERASATKGRGDPPRRKDLPGAPRVLLGLAQRFGWQLGARGWRCVEKGERARRERGNGRSIAGDGASAEKETYDRQGDSETADHVFLSDFTAADCVKCRNPA
jgi:hypothetical protein